MKKPFLILLIIILAIVGFSIFKVADKNQPISCSKEAKLCADGTAVGRTGPNCEFAACPSESSCAGGLCAEKNFQSANALSTASLASTTDLFAWPLDRAWARITKKPFGIKVSPTDSPISPERFSGYHTGVDFETFAEEQAGEVLVKTICSGPLVLKKWSTGYGGLAVQKCQLGRQAVTVVYGHLNITSISAAVGQEIKQGQGLGLLGQGYSKETDGERKHLHLGVHRGAIINLLGYVPNKSDSVGWLEASQSMASY